MQHLFGCNDVICRIDFGYKICRSDSMLRLFMLDKTYLTNIDWRSNAMDDSDWRLLRDFDFLASKTLSFRVLSVKFNSSWVSCFLLKSNSLAEKPCCLTFSFKNFVAKISVFSLTGLPSGESFLNSSSSSRILLSTILKEFLFFGLPGSRVMSYFLRFQI